MPSDNSASGVRLCWDGEECPCDCCDGELEQQDRFNVMCLVCERVWAHYKDDTTHYLTAQYGESVAEKPRVETDGGRSPEHSEYIDRGASDMERPGIRLISCYKCHSVFAERAKHRDECPSCGNNPDEQTLESGEWYQLNRVVE